MREILFRGKRKGMMNWVEGTGIFTDGINAWLSANEPNRPIAYGLKHKIVLPETVGQFTGLTDKNGKKIFEGDVVIYDNSPYNVYCDPQKGEIVWRNGSLCFKYRPYSSVMYRALCSDDFFAAKCEVIGNIHDNPELLENP